MSRCAGGPDALTRWHPLDIKGHAVPPIGSGHGGYTPLFADVTEFGMNFQDEPVPLSWWRDGPECDRFAWLRYDLEEAVVKPSVSLGAPSNPFEFLWVGGLLIGFQEIDDVGVVPDVSWSLAKKRHACGF
jgi:hypothetical protein